jgi:hypothetical protein
MEAIYPSEISVEFYRTTSSNLYIYITVLNVTFDLLCGLVVRAPCYRSRVSGSIPGATRISEQ